MIELLCKGVSFCPTPEPNTDELNQDLFNFSRILRLKYHFRNSFDVDPSIVKPPSTFTPKGNQNAELEKMIDKLEHMNIQVVKSKDNIKHLRSALQELIQKTQDGEIIIKSADKGDITVIMSPEYYARMCNNELSKSDFYCNKGDHDPSQGVTDAVNSFAERYKEILTLKEYEYITKRSYKMAYFYMLPKLHKSDYINDLLKNSSTYVHITNFTQNIEGRPIVGGPCYHTSGLSEMIHIILHPILEHIPHIVKDSFDLLDRIPDEIDDDTVLGTCDIKSLYTNISKDLALKSIDFWVTKFQNVIPLLSRFSKTFILHALQIILDYNHFLYDDEFIRQIKGFAMGTKAAVVCANLVVAYLEMKMFALLPTIYPQDIVDFIIRNYFRFLDDLFYKWLKNFDITKFYEVFDSLDPDLKFIFSLLSTQENYLDIRFHIINNKLEMDIYRKPTDSFNFLHYHSCHPKHTRDNIALSLAKRIVRIVSLDIDKRLNELKGHLISCSHPEQSINYAFSKIYLPKSAPEGDIPLVFTSTHNPSHRFDSRVIKTILKDVSGDQMKKAFSNHRVVLGTRQPKNLRNLLTRSRFSSHPHRELCSRPPSGLFNCGSCIYHNLGYLTECVSFKFGQFNQFEWVYNRRFDCDSKNVIYIVICNCCWKFYIGETGDFKVRTCGHKSNTLHPENANCKKLAYHLNKCSSRVQPYFRIYPMYYVDDKYKRKFIEKRFIHRYKPPLNCDS